MPAPHDWLTGKHSWEDGGSAKTSSQVCTRSPVYRAPWGARRARTRPHVRARAEATGAGRAGGRAGCSGRAPALDRQRGRDRAGAPGGGRAPLRPLTCWLPFPKTYQVEVRALCRPAGFGDARRPARGVHQAAGGQPGGRAGPPGGVARLHGDGQRGPEVGGA